MDQDGYYWLLDHIAPLIVGNNKYEEESKKRPPTQWMTTASEAFAMLCLENYYNNIQDVASNNSNIRKPLWTSKGIGVKQNQGWSKEGLEKFGVYCKAC